jgi:hypothetical protein
MIVANHLRPAAIKAGVYLKPGWRFGFHNLRHSLSSFLITRLKLGVRTTSTASTIPQRPLSIIYNRRCLKECANVNRYRSQKSLTCYTVENEINGPSTRDECGASGYRTVRINERRGQHRRYALKAAVKKEGISRTRLEPRKS